MGPFSSASTRIYNLKNEQVQSPLEVETGEIEQVLPEEERVEEETTETVDENSVVGHHKEAKNE